MISELIARLLVRVAERHLRRHPEQHIPTPAELAVILAASGRGNVSGTARVVPSVRNEQEE